MGVGAGVCCGVAVGAGVCNGVGVGAGVDVAVEFGVGFGVGLELQQETSVIKSYESKEFRRRNIVDVKTAIVI